MPLMTLYTPHTLRSSACTVIYTLAVILGKDATKRLRLDNRVREWVLDFKCKVTLTLHLDSMREGCMIETPYRHDFLLPKPMKLG